MYRVFSCLYNIQKFITNLWNILFYFNRVLEKFRHKLRVIEYILMKIHVKTVRITFERSILLMGKYFFRFEMLLVGLKIFMKFFYLLI